MVPLNNIIPGPGNACVSGGTAMTQVAMPSLANNMHAGSSAPMTALGVPAGGAILLCHDILLSDHGGRPFDSNLVPGRISQLI